MPAWGNAQQSMSSTQESRCGRDVPVPQVRGGGEISMLMKG